MEWELTREKEEIERLTEKWIDVSKQAIFDLQKEMKIKEGKEVTILQIMDGFHIDHSLFHFNPSLDSFD